MLWLIPADRHSIGLFGRGLDVILTPSAPGEAPEGLHTTGHAPFSSRCGLYCMSLALPFLLAVGRRGCRWVFRWLDRG